MSDINFKNKFCPSPWFHMRIVGDGTMTHCRWADKNAAQGNVRETSIINFFQQGMADIRSKMINGQGHAGCSRCYQMEEHGKISGRQKQLLKVGVRLEQFEKTLASSPWIQTFADADCTQLPQDWQIDLGNYCNSACIFCSPQSSSKLATEWKKIGFIDSIPESNWSDDPVLVNEFIDTLKQSKHIQYLHFIGGETLITPSFKKILETLIDTGINKTATIGFTTNLISWDNRVVELLTQFEGLNLGMSIESFDTINEYVRWPAAMSVVNENLNKWQDLAKKHNWLIQFRTTPTILTIDSLLSVYEYAWQNNIVVESCNFLTRPSFMKPSVMPMSYRKKIIDKMERWVDNHDCNKETIVNIRNPNTARQQLVQDLQSYINYLKNEPDESHLLPELILFLKKVENSRGNKITDYLPEYEELFRSAGY